eukprot:TRINITY_DN5035_c0_g2_i2.p1 TRINITY_DN5035_c0_g2~~TRINITY_DN5035_c0_g2_i2.p1  ORF type:complete len:461 (-),score=68.70 TRINITY_DN5035_c0_g2_i2:337-1719(-)
MNEKTFKKMIQMDCTEWVPTDILIEIFNLMDLYFTIDQASRVCRRWKKVLLSERFWKGKSMSDLPITLVYEIIKKFGQHLETLQLRNCNWFDRPELIGKCTNLKSMDIASCNNLRGNETVLAIKSSPHLRSLDISMSPLSAPQLKSILAIPSLQCLIAKDCKWNNASFKNVHNTTIRELHISSRDSIYVIPNLCQILPSLTSLDMGPSIHPDMLRDLPQLKNLKRLWASTSDAFLSAWDVSQMRAPQLEELALINPKCIQSIFQPETSAGLDRSFNNAVPMLRVLHLRHATISDLVPIWQASSLRELTLIDCHLSSETLASSQVKSPIRSLSFEAKDVALTKNQLLIMCEHCSNLNAFHIKTHGSNQHKLSEDGMRTILETNPISMLTLDCYEGISMATIEQLPIKEGSTVTFRSAEMIHHYSMLPTRQQQHRLIQMGFVRVMGEYCTFTTHSFKKIMKV